MYLNEIGITFLAIAWQQYAERAGEAAVKIAVILVGYLVVRFVIFRLVDRLFAPSLAKAAELAVRARSARIRALQTVLKSAAGFTLGLVAAIMILQAAGINITPLIMSASVAGLAVGFGAQKLVRDVIAGFFILMEDQYGVGDHVTIGGVAGVVEELGMRTTRIRDAGGRLHIFANGDIAQVCNLSRGKLRVSMDIAVPASMDLDRVISVLNEVGDSIARDCPQEVLEPFRYEGLAQVTGATATLRLEGSVVPAYQEAVRMEMNARIREAFMKHEIQLA